MKDGEYYLPPPYDVIARIAGIDAALEVAKEYGGEQVYMAKYETVIRPIRDVKIRREFNGFNFKALARRYQITEQMVRNIVSDEIMKKQREPMPGQVSMFDE